MKQNIEIVPDNCNYNVYLFISTLTNCNIFALRFPFVGALFSRKCPFFLVPPHFESRSASLIQQQFITAWCTVLKINLIRLIIIIILLMMKVNENINNNIVIQMKGRFLVQRSPSVSICGYFWVLCTKAKYKLVY